MDNSIDGVMQRTRAYYYRDGMAEVVAGVVCLLAGGLLFLGHGTLTQQESGTQFSRGSMLLAAIIIVLVAAAGLGLARVLQVFKARVTHPRTGAVMYRQHDARAQRFARRTLPLFLVAVMVLVVFVPWLNRLSVMMGFFLGAFLVFLGGYVGLRRFYGLAAFSVLVGVAVNFFGWDDIISSIGYLLVMGLGLIVSGAAVLAHYLRQPVVTVEE